jgi:hypothetical protein
MKNLHLILLIGFLLIFLNSYSQTNFKYDSGWKLMTLDGGKVDNDDYGAALGKVQLNYKVVLNNTTVKIDIKINSFKPNERYAYTVPNQNKRAYTLGDLQSLGISNSTYNFEMTKNFNVKKFLDLTVRFECNNGNHIETLENSTGTKIKDELNGPFYIGKNYQFTLNLIDPSGQQNDFAKCAQVRGYKLALFNIHIFTQNSHSKLINDYILKNQNTENNNQTKPFDQTKSASKADLKRPYEYTKQEWESMSIEQQEASWQYNIDNPIAGVNSTNNPQINEQLQNIGFHEAAKGNYGTAIVNLSNSGDNLGGAAVAAFAIIDGLFGSSGNGSENNEIHSRADFWQKRGLNYYNNKMTILKDYINAKSNDENEAEDILKMIRFEMLRCIVLKNNSLLTSNVDAIKLHETEHERIKHKIKSFLNDSSISDDLKIELYMSNFYSSDIDEPYITSIFKKLDVNRQQIILARTLDILHAYWDHSADYIDSSKYMTEEIVRAQDRKMYYAISASRIDFKMFKPIESYPNFMTCLIDLVHATNWVKGLRNQKFSKSLNSFVNGGLFKNYSSKLVKAK